MQKRDAPKTPSPPKVVLPSLKSRSQLLNNGETRDSNHLSTQQSSTSKAISLANKYRNTPSTTLKSHTINSVSKPYTFVSSSSSKAASKPLEDLSARLKRLEDSGLLRRVREFCSNSERFDALLNEDEEECDDVFDGKAVNRRSRDDHSNEILAPKERNERSVKSKKNLNTNFDIDGKLTVSQTQASKSTEKAKGIVRQSKSEPDINMNNANMNSVQEKEKIESSKSSESKSVPLNNALKKSQSATKLSKSSESDLKSLKINNRVYLILNLIGQGGSSKVYQVYEPLTQKTFALKLVDLSKSDESTRNGFKNEIKLLSKLKNCERVIKLYDYCLNGDNQQLILIMEKGDSDLGSILRQFVETKNRYSLDPDIIKHYWKEMLKAVDEIHKMDIVHSDLKPVNFVSVGGKLKLIDFGIANAIDNDHTSVIKDSLIGTINYMAPEALSSKQNLDPRVGKPYYKFNCKADIWSLGCILYNLVYGRAPFAHYQNLIAKIQAICDPKCQIEFPSYENRLVIDCIKLCLQRDPKCRPSTKELLQHPYLKDSTIKTIGEPHLNTILSRISNLTPTRIAKLSKVCRNNFSFIERFIFVAC
ncbi:dual specificity protein kinase TTK-like protein [Dinothrombium tinctorium]|uniref:Dual specificity protein kinase TTK-like protein n=1 Tax=Dinothrombium tinctorium TaxID=1965070 RepID=A0A443QJD2_9ACAR|nr:dual specificity protein kinase TTK-like protein [Dinothrombium tinctorium]